MIVHPKTYSSLTSNQSDFAKLE